MVSDPSPLSIPVPVSGESSGGLTGPLGGLSGASTSPELSDASSDAYHGSSSADSPGPSPPSGSPGPFQRLSQRLSRRYRWGILPIAIGLSLGGVYFFSARGQDAVGSGPENAAGLVVAVVTVEPVSQYTTEREYTGELVAARRSELGFELGGTVVSLLVQEGDRVVAGQPLARLDTRTLGAQRQQLMAQRQGAVAQLRELQAGPRQETIAGAAAAVREAEQQLTLAQLQRDRRQHLYSQGAISQEELDRESYNTGVLENRLAQAQSQLTELQRGTRREQLDAQGASVAQIDASLEQLDVELAKSVLVAPFDGIVSDRLIDEGVVVAGGQGVISLVEAAALEARVGIPPATADRLRTGSEQQVLVGDRPFTATLTALLPELDVSSRTVTAVLQMPVTALTVGQTARLRVQETQAEAGFWLPTTALTPGERGLWAVYVLGQPGEEPTTYTVGRREVEVVHTEGERALVRGTLQAGDNAIVTGTHRIVPGNQVRIR